MPNDLTKKLLQIVAENTALKNQVRRLQSQVKFLKRHCDCPPPPPSPLLATERAHAVKEMLFNTYGSRPEP